MGQRIALGGDTESQLLVSARASLEKSGCEVTLLPIQLWGDVAHDVASRVARGEVDGGILFCWTGTGVSIAANKVAGIRAALCVDAETAKGARKWNNANVLCLSLRLTTEALLEEILGAWMSTKYEGDEKESLLRIQALEALRD